MMFGSDYPSIPYDRLLREWDELGYTADVREHLFHRNAERVLGLSRPGSSADRTTVDTSHQAERPDRLSERSCGSP
jgi:hypothetical protein